MNEPAAGNYFVSAYPPFSCWSQAGVEPYVARLKAASTGGAPAPLGLYVHIPFCVHRCQYCYYLAYDHKMEKVDAYLDALAGELELYRKLPALESRPLSFVYFGGGTPSLLSVPRLQRLLSRLQAAASWEHVREATFECAPLSVTEAKLETLLDAGITRLSLGVQQLDDGVLAQNGRVHGVADVLRAYERVRDAGFRQVNLDLIAGLIGETDDSFERSLEQIIDLEPDSVTIYQLEIPLNTPLFRALKEDSLPAAPASWETKRERLRKGFAMLEGAGYAIRSAYTAVRDPAKDEFVYQDELYGGADMLGIGVASFSYFAGAHQQNLARLDPYLDALASGGLPLGRAYALDDEERMVREFVLQLKLGRVDGAAMRVKHGVDIATRFAAPLERFLADGFIELEGDAVQLTRAGLLRVDRMIPEFYLDRHQVGRYS